MEGGAEDRVERAVRGHFPAPDTGHRIARDLNGDGRRDYLVRYRAADGCLEGSDAPARVEHREERWIDDPAADRWRREEAEDQP